MSDVEKTTLADLRTDADVRRLPDDELLQLHHRLHQLYGAAQARGEATEYPYVNLHVWVVAEMERRGMTHNVHDELDRETERLRKGMVPGWIAHALEQAEDMVLIPAYISVVGSAVSETQPNDLDVLVREEAERLSRGMRESIYLLVRRLLDPEKRGLAIHLLANAQGPHLPPGQGYIPLFDLVLRPRRKVELVTKDASAMPDWQRWLEEAPSGRRVDLGPGEEGPPEGFEPLGRPYDLNETWPLESNSVAVLRANHVFEHLPEPTHAMTEAWRVLMPGGLLIVTVPEATSPGAVAHPEHRSFWNADSFRFWSNPDLLQTVENRVPQAFELLYLGVREEDGLRYVDAVLRKPDDGIQKRALVPITTFTPPKPAMKGRAHTDAFSPDEIWPWVERHLEAGVVAEPKYNGFRCCAQHKHPRLSLRFEDSQQERADKLLQADPRLKALHDLPDFILDCDVGVVEDGKRWPRPRLMTLTADQPELPEGARIAITAFDVLYWDGESVNERPFRERRALLEKIAPMLHTAGIEIPPQMPIRTKADLERAWRSPKFGLADRSEGLVLKALDWVYRPGPATDGMAKWKHSLEVKAIVLEVKQNSDGSYNFRGGLLPGTMADQLENLVDFPLRKSDSEEFNIAPEDRAPEAFEVREIAVAATPRRLLALDLFSGNGQFKRFYQRHGFSVVSVDKDKTKPVRFKMTAERFIQEHLADYMDFDLVDFDDSGSPFRSENGDIGPVHLFFAKIEELGRRRPFTLVITDGMAHNLKRRDTGGATALDRYYLLGRPSRDGDYERFEEIHCGGVRRIARRYGFEAKLLICRRYSRGDMTASAWRIHRVAGSS